MKRWVVNVMVIVLLVGLTISMACTKSAEFKVSAFDISPSEAVTGEPITVTVDIKNIGGNVGSYTVTLKIDGVELEKREVTLAAGVKETIKFTVTKNELGTYNIEVLGLSGTVKVLKSAPPIPDTTVEVTRDVEYGKADEVSLLLDIYTPGTPMAIPMPAVIWIHGGGWFGGDKSGDSILGLDRTNRIELLAEHGFFGVSINYRLSGVAQFPAAVEDCKCAVRWLRANVEKYNVDPDRIGVWGSSAGGHLATMVGLVDETAGFEGSGGWVEYSSRVQAVCSYYGASDLMLLYRMREADFGPVPDSAGFVRFLGGHLGECPEMYQIASPVNYVTSDDPPILLVHGELDRISPPLQSQLVYEAYQELGLEATLVEVEGAGHTFKQMTGSPISPSEEEIEEIVLDFFVEHLLRTR